MRISYWLLFCGFLTLSTAQADSKQILVTGEAVVNVSPDRAAVFAGIESWDRSLSVARKHNDETLKKALAVAEEFKVAKDSIQIDFIGVEVERKGWNERPVHQTEGYFVRRNLTFNLKDLSRFDDFLGKLLDAGVNQIQGVEFQTSELRKHRDSARELAVKASHEKAIVMAHAVGQKVGKAIQIKEETDSWISPYSARPGGRYSNSTLTAQNVSGASGGDNSVPGKIAIRALVSSTFQLE